jgi:hypothetical protein
VIVAPDAVKPKEIVRFNKSLAQSRHSVHGHELSFAIGRCARVTVGLSKCSDCRKPPPGHAALSPTA